MRVRTRATANVVDSFSGAPVTNVYNGDKAHSERESCGKRPQKRFMSAVPAVHALDETRIMYRYYINVSSIIRPNGRDQDARLLKPSPNVGHHRAMVCIHSECEVSNIITVWVL